MLVWSTPLGLPGRRGGRMHQDSKKVAEEEEGNTLHVDTWRNARVWG